MSKNIIGLVLVGLVLWFGFSTYWYVCEIRDLCDARLSFENGGSNVASRESVGSVGNVGSRNTSVNTITERSEQISCPAYIGTTISPTATNNVVADTRRLQEFFNEYYNESLDVDGVYDNDDMQAVMRFQEQFAEQILVPVGLSQPNAVVGLYTATQINSQKCAFDYAQDL